MLPAIDVNDLHKFVSVALHTSAGEGDFSSDKLSHLKTVGSGFGPLIYTLQKDPNFHTFQEGCKAVWKAIEQTPNLPTLLVSFTMYITILFSTDCVTFLCSVLATVNWSGTNLLKKPRHQLK